MLTASDACRSGKTGEKTGNERWRVYGLVASNVLAYPTKGTVGEPSPAALLQTPLLISEALWQMENTGTSCGIRDQAVPEGSFAVEEVQGQACHAYGAKRERAGSVEGSCRAGGNAGGREAQDALRAQSDILRHDGELPLPGQFMLLPVLQLQIMLLLIQLLSDGVDQTRMVGIQLLAQLCAGKRKR